jgi:cell wall-associated NlpC family hydrolase
MKHRFSIYLSIILFITLSSCFSSRKTSTLTPRERKDKFDTQEYSKKLGIPLRGDENAKLIKEAASWMGTPYRDGGCSLSGTDCSCLIGNIYSAVYGIQLERSSADIARKNCAMIPKSELREGDLVFFSIKKVKISHVGLYIRDGYFIHATTSKGVLINNLDEAYYQKYYTMSGRVKILR